MVEIIDAISYFGCLQGVIQKLSMNPIEQVRDCLLHAHEHDRMVFLFGNGGERSAGPRILPVI